jgi:dTDP-4-dehydrorhamnose reductase
MKIVVNGANGQLGTDLVKALRHHADADITDFAVIHYFS